MGSPEKYGAKSRPGPENSQSGLAPGLYITATPIGNARDVSLRALDVLGLSPLAPFHYLTYHREFYFDVAPLLKLGWKPKYSNDEMFRESYDWFLAHRAAADGASGGSPHRRRVREGVLWLLKKIG